MTNKLVAHCVDIVTNLRGDSVEAMIHAPDERIIPATVYNLT